MHESVMDFIGRELRFEDVTKKRLLEVGSRDVNGSVRQLAKKGWPSAYVGIDMMAGPGVDEVLKAEDLVSRFGAESFDTVISVETLEHVEFWRKAVVAMKAVLRPGGILMITTRAPGFPMHAHPSDFWRFTLDNFREIFADLEILVLEADPQADHPGVFMKARKPVEFKPIDLAGVQVKSVG